jgi:hypothetical protein
MKNLLPIIILVLSFSACQKQTVPEIAFPAEQKTQITIDEAALRIVSKDANQIVSKDDIRVKRVQYLLTELSNDGDDFSFYSKCHLLELSTKLLADSYGVKKTMQEYLEEMKKAKDLGVAEALNQKPTFANLVSLVSVKYSK